MIILHSAEAFTETGSVLALGMFDGVHIGHQALIREAVRLARGLGAASVVCTFDRHPLSVLMPNGAPEPICSPEENLRRFELLGADYALVQRFDRAFADIPAETYLRDLTRGMRARAVVVGEDHTFGRKGRGDAALVAAMADECGYRAVIVPPVCAYGREVSSTWIRALLAEGDEAKANELMRIGE